MGNHLTTAPRPPAMRPSPSQLSHTRRSEIFAYSKQTIQWGEPTLLVLRRCQCRKSGRHLRSLSLFPVRLNGLRCWGGRSTIRVAQVRTDLSHLSFAQGKWAGQLSCRGGVFGLARTERSARPSQSMHDIHMRKLEREGELNYMRNSSSALWCQNNSTGSVLTSSPPLVYTAVTCHTPGNNNKGVW